MVSFHGITALLITHQSTGSLVLCVQPAVPCPLRPTSGEVDLPMLHLGLHSVADAELAASGSQGKRVLDSRIGVSRLFSST